jgi:NADH-quinone oxidoreductase subunit N
MGYLLVAFLAGGALAVAAVTFYLLAYFITTLGAFGVITALSGKETDFSSLAGYRGLAFRHPFHGVILSAMMFSLAGIPLTAGFLAKFFVLFAGVRSVLWLLVLTLVANSVIGLFYYLRVIIAIYQPVPSREQPESAGRRWSAPSASIIGGIVLVVLTIGLVWLGVYPGPVIHWIDQLVGIGMME